EKLFLLAIVNALRRKRDSAYVTFGEAEDEYIMICEKYGLRSRRSHGQLWHYLKDMENTWRIIETRPSGKGMRGRTTLISIPYESLDVLAQELTRLVEFELAVR
nr:cell division control protein Cdc6 [Caldivirga sp.]